MHCIHPSMMNVLELKLLSSSSPICSVSLMTDEDEEDKEGDEEGSQTINNNNNNTDIKWLKQLLTGKDLVL